LQFMNVKLLLREICPFINENANDTNPHMTQIRSLASKVLFALSLNNFGAVFSRIQASKPVIVKNLICQLHPVLNRLQELSDPSEESSDFSDIELIQHINVDINRLIKLFNESINKLKSLRKQACLVLISSLEKAVWNWLDNYPEEFADIQAHSNDELNRCCDQLFEILDNFSDSNKRRASTWPLQIILLALSPVSNW
ncbi:unnamed protein product, partial [Cyprideis torosa]